MNVVEWVLIVTSTVFGVIGLSVSVYSMMNMKRMVDDLMRFVSTGQWERPTEGMGRIFNPYNAKNNNEKE